MPFVPGISPFTWETVKVDIDTTNRMLNCGAHGMTIEYYHSGSTVAGITYGQWTVLWWQWALSVPASKNPVVDDTGKNASQGQRKDVWFLAGRFGVEDSSETFPTRECSVPAGIPILFPILNCEADTIEYPHLRNDQDILDHVLNQVDGILKKECYMNDQLVPSQRVQSDPNVFDLNVHPDFDKAHKGGHTRAAADGYWVFLKPLPKGNHAVRFQGSCQNGRLNSGATYDLNII
jgi:hypothetical protein